MSKDYKEDKDMAVMTKLNNMAFVVKPEKIDEFRNLKSNKANLRKIKEKSKKMRECIVRDERHQKG